MKSGSDPGFCLFLIFQGAEEGESRDQVTSLARRVPGIERGLAHTPAKADDPFLHDGAPPGLVLQLYFRELPHLEAAVAGPLQALPPAKYEAMLVRTFAVPQPAIDAQAWCTYLVAYEGTAEDPHAWLAHYLAHHPSLMARLPGIRELEIYTALDWVGELRGRRVRALQRNKVAFDSPQALSAALNSPLREEMRADFRRFPPFSGRVTHYPMFTRRIPGSRDPS